MPLFAMTKYRKTVQHLQPQTLKVHSDLESLVLNAPRYALLIIMAVGKVTQDTPYLWHSRLTVLFSLSEQTVVQGQEGFEKEGCGPVLSQG
jgi:hypothetical protein